MDNLPKQYLDRWFHGQQPDKEESDAFWQYLETKPRQLRFTPEQAFDAAKEFFAYALPAWRSRHDNYLPLSPDELWEKLDNFCYNFLREWRRQPSREHREVVCSAYEASERTEENSEAMEARDISSGDVARLGAPDALGHLSALYDLPSVAWLTAEGGFGGAMIARLLNRRLPPVRTLELLLRILILHPLPLPSDLKKYRKPLVAHIARTYWANGKEGLVDQKTMADALDVSAFEISKAKDSSPPARPAFTAEDVDDTLHALEVALDQEWSRVERRLS